MLARPPEGRGAEAGGQAAIESGFRPEGKNAGEGSLIKNPWKPVIYKEDLVKKISIRTLSRFRAKDNKEGHEGPNREMRERSDGTEKASGNITQWLGTAKKASNAISIQSLGTKASGP